MTRIICAKKSIGTRLRNYGLDLRKLKPREAKWLGYVCWFDGIISGSHLISYRIPKQTQKPEDSLAFRLPSQHSKPLYYNMRIQEPLFSPHISSPPPPPFSLPSTETQVRAQNFITGKVKQRVWLTRAKADFPPDHICFKPTSFITTESPNGSIGEKAVQGPSLCCYRTRTGPRFSHMIIMVCGERGP